MHLRSVPGNKVHAVCKMHQIKCAGILGWKMVAQLISRHGLDFVLFLSFSLLIFSMFFFLQAETPPAAQQNTFYESLRKARRRRHFSVFGSSPKRIDTNWFHQFENNLKNTRYTFKQKQHIYLFIYLFFILIFIYLFLLFYFYSHCFFLMFIFNMLFF